MTDLNTTLATLRRLAPDIVALQAELGPFGTDINPVVVDYLDATCPGWRKRAPYLTARCSGCNTRISRPLLLGTLQPFEYKTPAVAPGVFVPLNEDSKHILLNWPNVTHLPGGFLMQPNDVYGYTCTNTGCCGYSGKPGNCTCNHCGATVGTLHTDCCGAYYFHSAPPWITPQWGLHPFSDDDKAQIAHLQSLPREQGLHDLWRLPTPLSPPIEATALRMFGAFGTFAKETYPQGYSEGWTLNHVYRGRWVMYDSTTKLSPKIIDIFFYDANGNRLGPHLKSTDTLTKLSWHNVNAHHPTASWYLDDAQHNAVVELLLAPWNLNNLRQFIWSLPLPNTCTTQHSQIGQFTVVTVDEDNDIHQCGWEFEGQRVGPWRLVEMDYEPDDDDTLNLYNATVVTELDLTELSQ